ncbi:MAG: sigma-70 family RNA polymerase sigma factor [Archangiaceae bacterium]|nr:sigma-70 family RNA polymerase sigma factor [Archangiaceae bacterium]
MSLPRGASRAFLDALTPAQRRTAKADRLDDRLARVVAQARQRWPGVEVPLDGYLAHLGRKLEGADVEAALDKVKSDDLYIAYACSTQDAAAVEKLSARVEDDLLKALAPFRLDAGARDEVLQRLRERLFVGRPKAPARIVGFAGSGPLAGWLCAAAVRIAIDLTKETNTPVNKTDDDEVAEKLEDPTDLEMVVIKRKYQREFRAAFQIAFRALSAEERNLIRFNFIDGLNIEQIGAMQRVHRSTIARRIAKIRQELFDGTRRALREKFKLSSSELNSLLRLVKSDFDVSIHEALREPTRSRSP